MVVDAVCSRRRNYQERVLPMVDKWESASRDGSLESLIIGVIDDRQLGLMAGEAETLRQVARGLRLFGEMNNSDSDDSACLGWANAVEDVRYVPGVDPFVGSVKGIGPALFAYLRILCGVDAIKPDVRVRHKLESFGFDLPKSDIELMHICELFADDLGIHRRIFDMMLWENLDNSQTHEFDTGEGMMVLLPGEDHWKSID